MDAKKQTARTVMAADHGGTGAPRMSRPLVPGIPSRVVDASGVVKRQDKFPGAQTSRHREPRPEPEPEREPATGGAAGREGQLVVGRGICFKGDIKACDTLIVHGQVEASLPARAVQVAEGGDYRGSAEVEAAEIAGTFDGTLSVGGRLTVTPTGRVTGTIRYLELEIAPGGRITGDVQLLDTAEPAAATPPAAEPQEAAAEPADSDA